MSAQRCPAPTAPSPPPTPQMLHGEAYVAGGWDGRAVLASAERLDLASGRSGASNSSKRNRVCAARGLQATFTEALTMRFVRGAQVGAHCGHAGAAGVAGARRARRVSLRDRRVQRVSQPAPPPRAPRSWACP